MFNLIKVVRISVLLLVVLTALVTIAGKGGGGAITPAPTTTSVAIEPATAPVGLPVNFPVQLKAKATLSNGDVTDVTKTATWASANSDILEVSATGVATGKTAGGPVVITATSGGTVSSPLSVEVKSDLSLTKLEITPYETAVLAVNAKRTHTAMATFSSGTETGKPIEVSDDVQWTSENEAVVRFDEPSVATGVGKGNTNIFATEPTTATNSNKLPIYVDVPTQARLEISPVLKPGEELIKGLNFPATATLYYGALEPADVTEQTQWSSSQPGIVSVSNAAGSKGNIVPASAGNATISAMVNGLTAEADYTVGSVGVTSLEINVPVLMPVGLDVKVQVFAILDDTFQTRRDVSEFAVLSIKDSEVATVSNAGVNKGFLTGLKAESTTIQAELPGTSLSAVSQAIGFQAAPLGSITVADSKPGQNFYAGRTRQFTAEGDFPALVSGDTKFDVTRQVTWTSSMESFATVSNALADKGLVSAIAEGVTSIGAEFEATKSPGVDLDVSPATLESIAIVPADPAVPLAARALQFKAMGMFSDMNVVDITESTNWFTSNTDLVSFDNRRAKGLAIFQDLSGSTTVTAGGIGALSGTTGQTLLTINSAKPTAVAISGPTTVEVGKEIQLIATGTFDDTSMHDVTLASGWSTNVGSATVLAGVVKGVAEGLVTITVRFDTGLTDTHEVAVTPAP